MGALARRPAPPRRAMLRLRRRRGLLTPLALALALAAASAAPAKPELSEAAAFRAWLALHAGSYRGTISSNAEGKLRSGEEDEGRDALRGWDSASFM